MSPFGRAVGLAGVLHSVVWVVLGMFAHAQPASSAIGFDRGPTEALYLLEPLEPELTREIAAPAPPARLAAPPLTPVTLEPRSRRAAHANASLAHHMADLAGDTLLFERGGGSDRLAAPDEPPSEAMGDGALAGVSAHGPVLLGHAACQRYFPFEAHVDAGAVTLEVEVGRAGDAGSVRVLEERPPRDGFGPAARSCARTLRFTPAVGRDGFPLPSTATLHLEFVRHRTHAGAS